MYKAILSVEGMMCPMCEKHMNEAIKKNLKVSKVTSSHTEKETEILSRKPLSEVEILEATKETGYTVSDIRFEKKKGFFGF